MLGIRIATDHFHFSADALGGAISALLGIGRSAVYLLELGIIHIHSECAFYSL